MTQLMNTRTNEVVTLIKKSGGVVVIENSQGKQHKIQEGTFKRYYKAVEAPAGAVTGRTQSAKPNLKEIPKTATPSKAAKKELLPAKKAVEKAPKVVKAKFDKEAAEKEVIEICQKLNVEYKANRTTSVVRFGNKNIAEIYFTTKGVRAYFNYQSIPTDSFNEYGLDNVPASWKWALETKLVIADSVSKSPFKKLLVLGRDYLFAKTAQKEADKATTKEVVKEQKAAAKTKKGK